MFPAHTRFMLPTHRYNGEISLFGALVFYGVRLKTSKTEIIAIPFQQIIRLYVRFDKGYHRRETSGGFYNEAQLRIECEYLSLKYIPERKILHI